MIKQQYKSLTPFYIKTEHATHKHMLTFLSFSQSIQWHFEHKTISRTYSNDIFVTEV